MIQNSRDVLPILRFELNYMEQGGFDRDRALLGTESPFLGNSTCINFDDPLCAHACHECLLYQFVDEENKNEEFPCHHIQLSDSGETVAKLIAKNDPARMAIVVEQWLRNTIARLETISDHNGES